MSGFSSLLSSSKEFESAKRAIKEKSFPMGIIGLSTVHKAHYISSICEELERKCIIVCPDETSASKLCDDLNVFSSGAVLYPARSISFRPTESQSREFEQKRIGVLSSGGDAPGMNAAQCSLLCQGMSWKNVLSKSMQVRISHPKKLSVYFFLPAM